MKHFFAALALLFLAFSPIQEEERIAWSKDYKLTWNDFKAKAGSGTTYVASTNSGLSFKYGYQVTDSQNAPDFTFEVNSYFYPALSWFKPKHVNRRVLSHEQTHFDITELHARILRKRIAEFNFSSNIKNELDSLYEAIEVERRAMQSQFDLETDHSTIVDKEAAWEQKIADLLTKYEPWQ